MLIMPLVIQAIADDNDRQFMEWLYTEFHGLMFSTAWKYANTQTDAEDIVSDSCLSLYKKIRSLRELERNVLQSYIVSTVRNDSIDFLRKQRRTNATFLQGDDEMMEQVADKATVEGKVILREELHTVREAISQLSPNERDVLRLKFQQGKKDCEIAEVIGLSESSVRKYVVRARQHLKDAIYRGEQL